MKNNSINYIEFGTTDLVAVKEFYHKTFGWTFTDYGEDYVAFCDSGLDGGFYKADHITKGGVLVVLYYDHLEDVMERIVMHGGSITQEIFAFPGGTRFHFSDPVGNELAVWSDRELSVDNSQ